MSDVVQSIYKQDLSYRPDIDGLRAIAILPVVIFHYFPGYAPGGFVGVDIFFVISGYLISRIIFRSLIRGNFSFVSFYARRVQRIFPALIVVLVACYVFGWFALFPSELRELGKHTAAGAAFGQNFVLSRDAGYFDTASELKPLMHLWSLAVEEQFYLVFPLIVWSLWRIRLNLSVGIVMAALVSFVMAHKDAYYSTLARMWELMAGSLLAYIEMFSLWPIWARTLCKVTFNRVDFCKTTGRTRHFAALRNLAAGVGLALIIASTVLYHKETPWPGPYTLPPVLGAVLLIAAGSHAWINKTLLSTKLLVWIGLISYPLYLWHWPLVSYMRITENGLQPREWRLVLVLISFVLAALTYELIEKPIRRGAPRAWKTVTLCIVLAAVGYAGYVAYERDGLAFRMEEFGIDTRQSHYLQSMNAPVAQDVFCKQRKSFEFYFCRLNKNYHPTILILGDSHGLALFPGLASELADTNEVVSFIGAPGCPPFRETSSFDFKTPEEKRIPCRVTANHALDVAKTDTIKTVILASRGPIYISGKDFTSEDDSDVVIFFHLRPDLTDHGVIWEEAMRTTLAELTAAGKQVIFLLDNPELGFHPKTCIRRPLQLINVERNLCAVPKAAFDERNREYRERVLRVLRGFPSVVLIDAAKPLCDDKWCWAIRENKMLYWDDDHLSFEGARLVAREILPHLSVLE